MRTVFRIQPVIDYSVRSLCLVPYPGRPKGCPNFNDPKHAHRCPPKAPLFDKRYNLSMPVYAVVGNFDVGAFAERMKEAHPTWGEKQCRNSIRWQGSARAKLKQAALKRLKHLPGYEYCECPEGMGVHVTKTMRRVGVSLWPFKDTDRHVYFLAKRR